MSKIWLLFIFVITLQLMSCSGLSCMHVQSLPSCGTEQNSTLCCPYNDGVCCNKSKTCCPKDSVCFSDVGFCIPRNKQGLLKTTKIYTPAPLFSHDLKLRNKLEVCPSKTMICPSKSTCCQVPYKGYDCCPLRQGTCCGDFQHCCPFNSTCDLTKRQCIDNQQNRIPWVKRMSAEKYDLTHVKKIKLIKTFVHTCPDRETKCEHNHTCCPNMNGKYECCAVTNGICCPGGTHCCPPGTVCGVGNSDCISIHASHATNKITKEDFTNLDYKNLLIGPSTHYQLKLTLNNSLTKACPGGSHSCPDYMSCCPGGTGKYGCCPFPKGVCCSDRRHCCPGGTKCDLKRNRCNRGATFLPLFETIQVTKISKPTVKSDCPDRTSCPDSFTCCQLPSLGYGCCPLANATCCSDRIHCCPHGTTCDLESGTCKQGNHVGIIMLQKIEPKMQYKQTPKN